MVGENSDGFTLIELMVSLFLSGLLLLGLMKIYVITMTHLQIIAVIHDLQSDGSTAFLILTHRFNQLKSTYTVLHVKEFQASRVPIKYGITAKANTDVLLISGSMPINEKEKRNQFAYFIADTHRKTKNNKNTYALFEKQIPGRRRELVTNISDMKIAYGLADQSKKDIKAIQFRFKIHAKKFSFVQAIQ